MVRAAGQRTRGSHLESDFVPAVLLWVLDELLRRRAAAKRAVAGCFCGAVDQDSLHRLLGSSPKNNCLYGC